MRFLKYLLVLIVILIAAVAAIPFLVPTSVIAEQVAKITRDQTGRELKLGGDVSFSIYPNIGISMEDVSLSNPPEMAAGVMMKTSKLRLSLQLAPLLSGNVKVKTFELVEPTLNLLTDVNGNSNWNFGKPSTQQDAPAEPSGSSDVALSELSLDDIRIVNGVVRYLDETAGTAFAGEQVNVALSLPSIQGNLTVNGSILWNGETVELATVFGPIAKLNSDKSTDIQLNVTSKHIAAKFNGVLSLVQGFALNGALETSSPSIRALAAWTGKPLAPGRGLANFSATAKLALGPGSIALNDAQLGLDGMRAQGNLSINTSGARPAITASLGVDRIDINQYLSDAPAAQSNAAPSQPGWSDEPIDFSGLKAVDASMRMAATQILYKDVTINNSQLSVVIKNGQLQANLERMSLYDGEATGEISLDGASDTPRLAAIFASQNISALPLLRDFAKFDWIEGKSKLTVNLAAAGRSQKQLVQTLGGNAQVLFEDGAIRGINVAQMMRGLGSNILNGWSRSETQKTDFASLSATYKITNGVAVNSDLQMIGPLVRLTGAGTVHMPNQFLDYTVDPKLVASLEGQGGQADLAGFNVPIKIKGPWSKPDIYPDIAGILDNPAEALKQLKAIGKIDPDKLGINADQLLNNGGDVIENVGENLQDAIQETLDPDNNDGGGVLNDLIQGLGNNN